MRSTRWLVWAAAGIGVIAAGAQLSRPDAGGAPEAVTASSGSDRPAPDVLSGPRTESALADYVANPARERVAAQPGGRLFGGQSWAPPKPPPAPKGEAIVARPAAPAFPYKYAGWSRHGQGGKAKVYLSKGGELLEVAAGEVLEGAWKIDAITEERVQVTFLPGGQQLAVLRSNAVSEPAPSVAAAPGRPPFRPAPTTASAPVQNERQLVASSAATPASPPAAVAGAMPFRMPTQQPTGTAAAVPVGRLGSEVPTSGSMPTGPAPTGSSMEIGPPPGGGFPMGATPKGKLGL